MMRASSPRTVIILMAALQFVYLLDFLMLMPLVQDVALALHFDATKIGWLSAAYTASALVAGVLGVRWLERWPRRKVVLIALVGLLLATLAATRSESLHGLLWARVLTGLCGAPAIAAGMALLLDVTPANQRGKAIAQVMTGFALAVVLGVPLALQLATWLGDWRAPFYFLASAMGILGLAMWRSLPASAVKLQNLPPARQLWQQIPLRYACLAQASAQFSAFLLVPQLANFYLHNLGVPRPQLSWLYAAGGIAAFVTVQWLGRLADKRGELLSASIASGVLLLGFVPFAAPSVMPVALFFILFMAGNAGRNISLASAIGGIALPQQRAAVMALNSLVQDAAMSVAALLSSAVLLQDEQGRLQGMSVLAAVAILFSVVCAWALWKLHSERRGEMCTQTL
ncbi:MAG: MFS transporter [Burkholderiales bacterium]|nr:MFS transporter [Burkholderiales bacterium]